MQLGEDWRAEANLLVNGSDFGSGSKCIFETSLETWLEINRMKKAKEVKEEDPDINYENVYYEMFLSKLKTRLTAICKYGTACLSVDPHGLPTLAMGFFFSANEIWESQITPSSGPNRPQGMFSLLSQTLQHQQLFRPLMRVTQRLFTFFNKRVKTEEAELQDPNFNKFKQTL